MLRPFLQADLQVWWKFLELPPTSYCKGYPCLVHRSSLNRVTRHFLVQTWANVIDLVGIVNLRDWVEYCDEIYCVLEWFRDYSMAGNRGDSQIISNNQNYICNTCVNAVSPFDYWWMLACMGNKLKQMSKHAENSPEPCRAENEWRAHQSLIMKPS